MSRSPIRLCLVLLVVATLLPLAGPAAPAANAAPGDNAIGLDGTTRHVEVPYTSFINFSGGSLTIEAWVKRADATRCEAVVGNGYLDSYWLGFCSDALFRNRLRFYHGDGLYVDSNAAIPAGIWTHIAVTYDGTTHRFYINGVLDKTSTANNGPLRPAPVGSNRPFGIGADPTPDAPGSSQFSWQYRFSGLLDELRIWRVVRTQEEIRASMLLPRPASSTGLSAAFDFNGNTDGGAFVDGVWQGAPAYSRDGALPHDIRIPQVAANLVADGICAVGSEYPNATIVFQDGTLVYMQQTADYLWVCFRGLRLPAQGIPDNWAAVYLDTDLSRIDPSQPDDIALEVHTSGTPMRERVGDGAGGYVAGALPKGSWYGDFADFGETNDEFYPRHAEFRISKTLLGANRVIGLALAQHGLIAAGDALLWPALATAARPSTWSQATLGGIGSPQTYNGGVYYQPRDTRAEGIPVPGVGVRLVGYQPGGGEAVMALARSDFAGRFSITADDDYPLHRLDLDVATLPRGYIASQMSRSASTTYSNNFSLQDAQPAVADPLNGPYFLIIGPRAIIDSGVLRNFISFKQQLGFQVETISVETIDSSVGGANRRDKIRNLEIARRATYGDRFKYVLLIGPHSVIPMAIMDILDEEGDCITVGLPSDWYYADLVSPMDSNGNGCIADGIWTHPANRRISTPPDSGVRFEPTVAVGRLPFTTVSAVSQALRVSMRFEQQAQDYKLRTMAPMSMMDLRARCWTPADDPAGHYEDCNTTGTDGAYLAAAIESGILTPGGYSMTPFYENDHPETGASPSHLTSPQPAREDNVVAELDDQDYGLVNLHGHGDARGVVRTSWRVDGNRNGIVETPAQPSGTPPRGVNEVGQPPLLTRFGMEDVVPNYQLGPPIFIVAACSTGDFIDSNSFGAKLLGDGQGAAWFGAVTTAQYNGGWTVVGGGGMNDLDYLVTRNLLGRHLRLGDAVWRGLSDYIARGNRDFSTVVFDLYGDPTLSYWGNGGGQGTLAAWPMLRQNAFGSGSVGLLGPGAPIKRWEYTATAPGTTTLPPAPLVSNNGEVIVAHGSFVDVLKRGTRAQRLELDAPAFGTPALAADGTIYALDAAGTLYAFDYNDPGYRDYRSERWTLSLGSAPLTSPVIGADGFVAVARVGGTLFGGPISFVTLVRPDGVKYREEAIAGAPRGALAVHADRAIYAVTDRGTTARLDFFCPAGTCRTYDTPGSTSAYSTPPLLAYGALYAGRSNGTLVKKHPVTLANLASFVADGAITAGPVAGPDGQILVGTAAGTLYSLTSNLALRWQRNIGAAVQSVPAFSADALYIVSGGRLWAYHPASGASLWDRALGAAITGSGSAAVGYGRDIYVQSSGGKIVAIGEGWVEAPLVVLATPVAIAPQQSLHGMRVEWRMSLPPLASLAPARAPQAVAPAGFLVQRSSDGSSWTDVATLPGTTAAYTDTSVASGQSYLYRVQALDATGNDSDFTTATEGARSLPALPQAPTITGVAALAADQLRVTWSQAISSEVTSYRLERGAGAGGPFQAIATTTGETREYIDSALAPGTTYFYRVVAINGMGASSPSNVASGVTRQRSLPAPRGVVASLLPDGRVRVSWSPGPAGVTAVVEVNPQGLAGYLPLGTAGAAGPYTYSPGMPSSLGYRVKFVQGNNESEYGVVSLRVRSSGFVGKQRFELWLPLVIR